MQRDETIPQDVVGGRRGMPLAALQAFNAYQPPASLTLSEALDRIPFVDKTRSINFVQDNFPTTSTVALYTLGVSGPNTFYRAVNDAIRTRSALLNDLVPVLFQMEQELELLPKGAPGEHYRGMTRLPDLQELREGASLTFAQLSSFTANLDVAQGFAFGASGEASVLLVGQLTNCINVESVSGFPEEQERLLAFHSRVVVEKVERQFTFRGQLYDCVIFVRQLPSSVPLFVRSKKLLIQRIVEAVVSHATSAPSVIRGLTIFAQFLDEFITAVQRTYERFTALEVVVPIMATIKAGKSTTLNAITQSNICPERLEPETLCVTLLRHDMTVAAPTARLPGGTVVQGNARDVVEKVNAQSRELRLNLMLEKKMDTAPDLSVITVHCRMPWGREYPMPVTLVDTPGGNEAVLQNAPQEMFRKSDLLLFVVDLTQVGSKDHNQLVEELKTLLGRDFERTVFLFNKADLAGANDSLPAMVDEFLQQVCAGESAEAVDRLRKRTFLISSRQAFGAQQFLPIVAKDPNLYDPGELDAATNFVRVIDPLEDRVVEYLSYMCTTQRRKKVDIMMEKSGIAPVTAFLSKAVDSIAEEKIKQSIQGLIAALRFHIDKVQSTIVVQGKVEQGEYQAIQERYLARIRDRLQQLKSDALAVLQRDVFDHVVGVFREVALVKRAWISTRPLEAAAKRISNDYKRTAGREEDYDEDNKLEMDPIIGSIRLPLYLFDGKGLSYATRADVPFEAFFVHTTVQLLGKLFSLALQSCTEKFAAAEQQATKDIAALIAAVKNELYRLYDVKDKAAHPDEWESYGIGLNVSPKLKTFGVVNAVCRRGTVFNFEIGALEEGGDKRKNFPYFPDAYSEWLPFADGRNPAHLKWPKLSEFPWVRSGASNDEIELGVKAMFAENGKIIARDIDETFDVVLDAVTSVIPKQGAASRELTEGLRVYTENVGSFAMSLEELKQVPDW